MSSTSLGQQPSPKRNRMRTTCEARQPPGGDRLPHQGTVLRTFKAVRDTDHSRARRTHITAFIGPSGCGKSTVLRCLNRMNDLVRGFRFEGHVHFRGKDIYHPSVDAVAVRRFIGMVFQQPNPFATSIFNNVAFGLRLNNFKGDKHAQSGRGLEARGSVGRGQGQTAQERAFPLRRAAAAAVHRPRHRHGAGSAADG